MIQQETAGWTEERVIQVIRELAAQEELPEHLQTAKISSADTVDTLGVDSIGGIALIDRFEAEVGVPLPDDFLDFGDNVVTRAQRLNDVIRAGGAK